MLIIKLNQPLEYIQGMWWEPLLSYQFCCRR